MSVEVVKGHDFEEDMMSQSVRQQARQKALEAQGAKRREREAAEKRRGAFGVDAAVAIEERDAAIARHELAAGRALLALTRDEGVSLQDVGEWVPDVEPAEAKRLRKLAQDAASPASGDADAGLVS